MNLQSTAFESGDSIPVEHTCDGENISPTLTWNGVPDEAQALALIVDDPDAPRGTFSHWVVYNLPPDRNRLERSIPAEERLSPTGMQGRNDFGNVQYEGPCPPRGSRHDYYFRLFALDEPLELMPGATRDQVLDAMQGHILEQTELIGRYERL
ncbi:MAG: YbhB/YbcL family Raf kinase inhibitor-like protein [Chloroflexota bacterium]